jgi:hypothetical protein
LAGQNRIRLIEEVEKMAIFGLTFFFLAFAAAGLAVGAMRGRPLPP